MESGVRTVLFWVLMAGDLDPVEEWPSTSPWRAIDKDQERSDLGSISAEEKGWTN
jgi:hypothetical protein